MTTAQQKAFEEWIAPNPCGYDKRDLWEAWQAAIEWMSEELLKARTVDVASMAALRTDGMKYMQWDAAESAIKAAIEKVKEE